MNKLSDLYAVRLKSFGYGLASLILIALIGVFASPDFAKLISINLGNYPVLAGFLLLLVQELVKHGRNILVTKKLGAEGKQPLLI